jgi:hypothetical protein
VQNLSRGGQVHLPRRTGSSIQDRAQEFHGSLRRELAPISSGRGECVSVSPINVSAHGLLYGDKSVSQNPKPAMIIRPDLSANSSRGH